MSRHKIAGNKLGRNTSLRTATIRDIAKAALIHQRVCTTKAKAKEARRLVEKLITLGKKGSLAHRRRAFAILCDHGLVSDLFTKTSPRFKNRIGGYTRIILLNARKGDNAQMVYLELTEKEMVAIKPVKSATGKDAIETTATEVKETSKGKALKDNSPKSEVAKGDASQVKSSGPKIVGGLKKIFQRKTSGGN